MVGRRTLGRAEAGVAVAVGKCHDSNKTTQPGRTFGAVIYSLLVLEHGVTVLGASRTSIDCQATIVSHFW